VTDADFGSRRGEKGRRRKVWVAALLSLLLTGLGQLYNGQLRRGLIFYLLGEVVGSILLMVAGMPLSLLLMAAVLLGQLSIKVVAIVDAGLGARRIGDDFRPARYNRPLVYLGTYLVFGVLLSAAFSGYLRENVVQAFKIPAKSMEPSLLAGDHILVDKSPSPLARGDIVVFEFPEDAQKENPRDFIKRVVGLSGDEIEVREKRLLVNGLPLNEPYVTHLEVETMPAGIAPRDFFGPVTVPEGKCFVMGDNRDRSYDSRFWGFVDEEKVRGRAVQIYWSWDNQNREVRWERIGSKVL